MTNPVIVLSLLVAALMLGLSIMAFVLGEPIFGALAMLAVAVEVAGAT